MRIGQLRRVATGMNQPGRAAVTDYMFSDHQADQELARLRLIEQAFDPVTVSHLESTGVTTGWHCLELGAGAGSILKWMGQTVGTSGRVVGVTQHEGSEEVDAADGE